jgi:O-antigen ligase
MNNLLRQFFDRFTLYGIGGLVVVHLVAWLTQHSQWAAIPLALIAFGVAIIACRSLLWGLSLAMLEIMVGGHGHLIDAVVGGQTIGLRLGIFVAVMMATAYHLIIKKTRPSFILERDLPFLLLLLAVGLGSIRGLLYNGFSAAFSDANAFVTLLYVIPVSMIVWSQEAKRRLLWTLGLGAVWVAGTSMVLLFCFTHLPGDVLWSIYKFARDARLAEITLLSNPSWLVALLPNGPWYFRVFQPDQFYVLILTLLLCAGWSEWGFAKGKRSILWILGLVLAIDVAGQSRSFWLGLLTGVGVIGLTVLYDRTPVKRIVSAKLFGATGLCLALIGLWVTVVFPLPMRPDLSNNPFYKGSADNTRGLAVTSRWNLLGPLMTEIKKAPILGSGFGTSITYVSDDPRIRASNPTGEYTTDRFEWGYQDIWLKMGIPGLLAFAYLLFTFVRSAMRAIREKHDDRWLVIGMMSGVAALYVAHVFSPYLNHPIGLGFLVLALPFFPWQKKMMLSMSAIAKKIPTPQIKPARSVVTVTRNSL